MTCGCPRDALCMMCVEDGFMQLRGVAATRAHVWAEKVARLAPSAQPWPAHEGRAADIARRKVADLTRDPRLAEMLAAELARYAAITWTRRRR